MSMLLTADFKFSKCKRTSELMCVLCVFSSQLFRFGVSRQDIDGVKSHRISLERMAI